METRRITVRQVLSPGSVVADDGRTYVLRGIPDTDEGFRNFAAARTLVERALLDRDVLVSDATARELPDLPGLEVEAFDTNGNPLMPGLAGRVAGILVDHPMKWPAR